MKHNPRRPSPEAVPFNHGLWSLWDIMIRFRVSSYAASLMSLGRAAMAIESADLARLPEDGDSDRAIIRNALAEADPSLEELPLSPVARYQFQQLQKRVDSASGAELAILVRELCNGLMVELSGPWFLMIEADKRRYYEQKRPPFGEQVSKTFHQASNDIAAASRCYALDEWTACVFHLMRVLEHGLKNLSEKVGFAPDAMRQENWKNIIDQIESKIREMEALPKNAEKSAKIQVLSEAATQFRYFKDAWRNHVAHSHASYDNHSGQRVWTHVKEFMEHLAAHVEEGAI